MVVLVALCKSNSSTASSTHTRTFNGPFSGTTLVSWHQKGKNSLDFTEGRDSKWQWHQLGHMQVCTSLQTDSHASTPPLSFYHVMLCIRSTSHGPVSVRPSQVGISSKRLNESSRFLACELLSTSPIHCVKRNSVISKNKGTSL